MKTEAQRDANREGVGHPRRDRDDKEEFNDAVEVTDKNMEYDKIPEEPEGTEGTPDDVETTKVPDEIPDAVEVDGEPDEQPRMPEKRNS